MPKRARASSAGSTGVHAALDGRRPDGTFRPGTTGNPHGNPKLRKLTEYRQAIHEAVSGEALRALFARLLTLAMGGDMMAAKLVLDRALGKANREPEHIEYDGIGIDALATAGDVKNASAAILKAMTSGRISADDGAKLAAVVELVRRGIETHELADRIKRLEEEGG